MNTIKNFIDGEFSLPDHPSVTNFELDSNVYNLSGMTYLEIVRQYPAVREYLLNMTLHCQIYVNITDEHAAYIFVNVLNNSTALTAQEKRNAIRSVLAKFVRETARLNPHSLFEIGSDGKLKHLNIDHKEMDVDKMIAELISMMSYGPSKGTGSPQINKLYNDESYLKRLPHAKSVTSVLGEALSGINRNPNLKKTFTVKVLRNYLYILNLMSKQNYKVQPDKFMRLFVKAHSDLSTKTKEHVNMGLTHSPYGHHMRGCGGKDTLKSIDMVMEKMIELSEGDEWVETDSRRLYSKEEIQIMAVNQNHKCGRCGYDLDDNPVGAHGYAWRDGGLTITGEGYAAHKYCNLEEGRGSVAKVA